MLFLGSVEYTEFGLFSRDLLLCLIAGGNACVNIVAKKNNLH